MPRIEYPGAIYHVSSRGRHRQPIFPADDDRLKFLELLGESVEKHNFLIHGYCLMANHYHLVLETPRANLSSGMQFLNGGYSRYFKKKYHNLASLFEGPYNAELIQTDSYLLETARYIVLNPVRAGMVRYPEEYIWSSYLATSGASGGPGWLFHDRILSFFEGDSTARRGAYIKFVFEGIRDARKMNFQEGLKPSDP